MLKIQFEIAYELNKKNKKIKKVKIRIYRIIIAILFRVIEQYNSVSLMLMQ